MSFIPSCDNRTDAIHSLAGIYEVSTETVEQVLLTPEMVKIAKAYAKIDDPHFHFVVSQLLGAFPREEITHAYYYHSTSYDGSPSWFDEGLLGSSQGVGRFLDKIVDWLPLDKQQSVKSVANRIVRLRSELEGSKADRCGPYAWNTLSAASSSEDGIFYRVPEAIRDIGSPDFYGSEGGIDLRQIIEERLKPVVVKFKGKTLNIDDYCATLWAYVFSGDDEYHLAHTFVCDGVTIPKAHIHALIEL